MRSFPVAVLLAARIPKTLRRGILRSMSSRWMLLRLERHRLGPRVYVLGRRVHEWHLGLALVAAAVVVAALGRVGLLAAVVIAVVGGWLLVKDWPDLSGRPDTAGWRLGVHRRPLPLRPARMLDDVPAVAAAATAIVGVVDLVSAVTPNVFWRGHVLLHV